MKPKNQDQDEEVENFNSKLSDVKIKYLLDNMVYDSDLEVSDTDIDLEMVDQNKDNGIEKTTYYISLVGNFIGKQLKTTDQEDKVERLVTHESNSGRVKCLAYPLNDENRTVLEKIKTRMANMKRFYPELYYRNESIISIWANTDISKLCNQKVLNYKDSSFQ
ncbi:hypothetical protein ILUMI_26331 [Ignelater luminosus]|uniref:Uncharacterized protein n=1 Tax=Ignelater luminosus TaxID=2038154 RepID=A0A8K0C4F3_IGNLU|nr:hypothetical protein ILUMI_26331 [Ignelater luminosus]